MHTFRRACDLGEPIEEIVIYKYTYHQSSMLIKTKLIGKIYAQDTSQVYLYEESGKRVNTSKSIITRNLIDVTERRNLNQSLYFSREDDRQAIIFYQNKLFEKISELNKKREELSKEVQFLERLMPRY